MEVTSIAKNIRTSPKKVKLVIDQIKKISPQEAIKMLDFVPKRSSLSIRKAILSAIADAKNNFGLSEDTLVFKQLTVSKGPVFKRFREVSRGRAHQILKRTSHIKVVLEGEERKKEVSKSESSQKKADQKTAAKNIK